VDRDRGRRLGCCLRLGSSLPAVRVWLLMCQAARVGLWLQARADLSGAVSRVEDAVCKKGENLGGQKTALYSTGAMPSWSAISMTGRETHYALFVSQVMRVLAYQGLTVMSL
jgi:hypothetical protein